MLAVSIWKIRLFQYLTTKPRKFFVNFRGFELGLSGLFITIQSAIRIRSLQELVP